MAAEQLSNKEMDVCLLDGNQAATTHIAGRLALFIHRGLFSELLEALVRCPHELEAEGIGAVVSAMASIPVDSDLLKVESDVRCLLGKYVTDESTAAAVLALAVVFFRVSHQAAVTGPSFSPLKSSDRLARQQEVEGLLRFEQPLGRDDPGVILESIFPAFGHPDRPLNKINSKFATQVEEALFCDGEPIYTNIPGLAYFWACRLLLEWLGSSSFKPTTLIIWRARSAFQHQRFLECGSTSLASSLVSIFVGDFARALKNVGLLPSNFNVLHGDYTFQHFCEGLEVTGNNELVLHTVPDRVRPLLLVELALRLSYCGNAAGFREVIRLASRSIGIDVELTGAMGVRRFFQKNNVPQLVVKTREASGPAGFGDMLPVQDSELTKLEKMIQEGDPLPEERQLCACGRPECPDTTLASSRDEPNTTSSVPVTSDVRLEGVDGGTDLYERPKLVDAEDAAFVDRQLRVEQQVVLLAHCAALLEASNVNDDMEMAKIDAYVQRCLVKPDTEEQWETEVQAPTIVSRVLAALNMPLVTLVSVSEKANWFVLESALWFRSRCEFHRVKRRERSLAQITSLIDKYADRVPSAAHRLALADFVEYPNSYEIRLEQARRLYVSGFPLGAKDLYLEMGLTGKAAECLTLVGRKNEALDLLKDAVACNPTPQVLVCYGDASDDKTHYERAWTLSGCRFAEAQRKLGAYYYKRGEFSEAHPAFVEALRINPQSANVWFCRGICEMRTGRFEEAAKSFARFCYLEEDNGEGWANMTAAHMSRQEWSKAYLSSSEAVRKTRSNWRVWDLHLRVSMRVRNLAGVLEALEALLKLNAHQQLVGEEVGIYDSLT